MAFLATLNAIFLDRDSTSVSAGRRLPSPVFARGDSSAKVSLATINISSVIRFAPTATTPKPIPGKIFFI